MGFFKSMVTSAGWAAGEKLVNGNGSKAAAEVERERMAAQQEQASQDQVRSELDSITSIRFGESADEISEIMNSLFAKAAQLPRGMAALGDDAAKAKKKAIIEKLEFGLFKLNKADPESAAFFQKKFDELSGKKAK